MKSDKRPRLPRGLHWREDSPYIWFTWRDPVGKQHRQSTDTRDPQEAALFRLQFMQKAEAGALLAALQCAQISSRSEEVKAEVGSDAADGDLGEIVAETGYCVPDAGISVSRPAPYL